MTLVFRMQKAQDRIEGPCCRPRRPEPGLRDPRGKFVLIDAPPAVRCDTEMEALAWLLSVKKQEES